MRTCSTEKMVNFATTVASPSTQEVKECIIIFDSNEGKKFAHPTKMTEVLKTVENLETNEALGN